MDWENSADLMGCDDPAEVEAAFERGEPLVGVAVMGLSLCVPDAHGVEPLVVRAMRSGSREVRLQGLTALSHKVRLTGEVGREALEVLHTLLHSPDTDVREHARRVAGDVWIFVPHMRLPAWLWVRATVRRVRWGLEYCWWTITGKYK
ncbi:hypothetical protein ABZT47_31770 [Sphaerisporangium sp. NPDC005289]|uniref:hypothetical protein n=1 Tax=Sphaerisporangium sp. NPDC005289 TaxID=3155247 RepID=UPI0033A48D65